MNNLQLFFLSIVSIMGSFAMGLFGNLTFGDVSVMSLMVAYLAISLFLKFILGASSASVTRGDDIRSSRQQRRRDEQM